MIVMTMMTAVWMIMMMILVKDDHNDDLGLGVDDHDEDLGPGLDDSDDHCIIGLDDHNYWDDLRDPGHCDGPHFHCCRGEIALSNK